MITVLGATGYIGNNLVEYLKQQNFSFFAPTRDFEFTKEKNLGHVIYCIGLTADFREKPDETIEAHVCKLLYTIKNATFDSFLYLSSTRVYAGSELSEEEFSLSVNPNNFSDLYNISKLMGESICLSKNNEKIRVVRLSNVIGKDAKSDNFFTSLIKEAVLKGSVNLRVPIMDKKDYIHINDVTRILIEIAIKGKHRLYNLGSGKSISNEQLIKVISNSVECDLNWIQNEIGLKFPEISVEKLKNEFNFVPINVLNEVPYLVNEIKKEINDTN